MEAFIPNQTPDPLPGTRILSLNANSKLQVIERLEQGLMPEAAETLAQHLGLSLNALLELLELNSSTFFKAKKMGTRLNSEASGRVYRLAKVVEAAENYFEDKETAKHWLERPKVALGSKIPLQFARTAEGADYIVNLLGRMAHGVIS